MKMSEGPGRRFLKAGTVFFSVILLSVFFCAVSAMPVAADWIETPEWRYLNDDGTFKRDEWVQEEERRYYLNSDGCVQTGFYTDENGKTYFFGDEGLMMTGLIMVDGKTYYLDENGELCLGELIVNGEKCLFTEDGLQGTELPVPARSSFYHDSTGKLCLEPDRHFETAGVSSWGLASWAVLVLGVLFFIFGRRREDRWELALLFAAVVFSSVPLFLPYLFRGHDLEFHICRIMGIRMSLENGIIPARLDGFSFNGYGYGELIFYPGLFLYIPAVLMYLGVPAVDSVNFWIFLCNAAAAGIMYYSVSALFRSRTAGCVSAILYTLAIYRLGNLYTRNAYGEMLALIFLPLLILGFYEVFFRDEKKWMLLTLAMTGIMESHIISAVLALAACAAAGLCFIRRLSERKRLAALLSAAVCTLLLNLWFIVPFLDYMRRGMNLEALSFPAERLSISLTKLLEIYPIAMGAMPVFDASVRETMGLTLGLPILAVTALFFWQQMSGKVWKDPENDRAGEKTAKIFFVAGLFLSLCATELFPWKLLVKMGWFRLASSYLQFPWRLLGPAVCVLSIAGAFAVCRQWSEKERRCAAAGILVLCLLVSQHYLDDFGQSKDFLWSDKEINSMLTQREYLYKDTDVDLAKGSELPAGPGIEIIDSKKNGLDVAFSYRTNESGQERYVDLPLFYYPGYRAEDSGGNVLPVDKSENGLVRVHFVSQNEGTVRVFFKERMLWRVCEAVSVITAAALLLQEVRRKNSSRRPGCADRCVSKEQD